MNKYNKACHEVLENLKGHINDNAILDENGTLVVNAKYLIELIKEYQQSFDGSDEQECHYCDDGLFYMQGYHFYASNPNDNPFRVKCRNQYKETKRILNNKATND